MRRPGLILALAVALTGCDREPQAGPEAMGKGEASALMDAEAMLDERRDESEAAPTPAEATPPGNE